MNRLSDAVIKHRKFVLILFLTLAVISVPLFMMVTINYDLVDYLPDDAQSTTGIEIMMDEFGGELPNARILLNNVTINEALDAMDRISAVDGVADVSWLDDVVGRGTLKTTPIEFLDSSIVENYYKDGCALISVTVESGKEKTTVKALLELIGEDNAMTGDAVNTAGTQDMSVVEVLRATAILIPVIILILILTTTSWLEPILFLSAIGVAVLINMGTNIFLGEISFITQTVSPILQLAVSLDYAIFLLHSFYDYRKEHDAETAMKLAMKQAVTSISASAATTVFGFFALIFMRFGIGADLGLNLVKGVLISFISVMIFLPALALMSYKWIDKMQHKKLIPDLKNSGKWLMKISTPFLIAAVLIAVPCYLAQSKIEFMYGMDEVAKAPRVERDSQMINEKFGNDNVLVLLVPKGDAGTELELCDDLKTVPHVKTVVSYVTSVGSAIPPQYLDQQITDQFYSQNYSRIILYTDMPTEGEESFATVRTVLDTADHYYDTFYTTGQSATLYDMKSVVSVDTRVVNLIAIISIFLVLLITYKSISVPFLLVFTIESAIWLNLSFAYFSDMSFSFIGYLIISTVQLGSTVDYAILLSDRYLGNRKELPKKEAMKKAIGDNILAILTSGTILATAGFTLALTSSNKIISELGTLLGRGTLLSMLMVACVLPSLLVLFDGIIKKTTLQNGFHVSKHPTESNKE